MATQPTAEIEPDPFETLGARFAFDYQEDGAREFKKLMAAIVATGKFHREAMQTAAVELMLVRLPKVAKLVRHAAAKCPSIGNIEVFWPYSAEPDPVNIRAAQAGAERKLKNYRRKAELLLRQVGLGLDWLGGEEELSGSGDLSGEGSERL